MGLYEQAKKDIEQITSNTNEWAEVITFIAPDLTTATITGLRSKIHLGVDTDGAMVNSRKTHISFSEKFLTDAGYPVRNDAGEVNIIAHRVNVKDSTGTIKKYVVQNIFPDETVGLIACTLEDFNE
jgi:hypothetical protein